MLKFLFFSKNRIETLQTSIFAVHFAQVAELVDALVSNTNEVTRAGSIPALGTKAETKVSAFFYF